MYGVTVHAFRTERMQIRMTLIILHTEFVFTVEENLRSAEIKYLRVEKKTRRRR